MTDRATVAVGTRAPRVAVPSAVRGAAAAAAVAFGLLAFSIQPFAPFAVGGDVWVYLAAGERLNAGHDLYALGPGDRFVPTNPPFWTTPLVAPPPVAVIWRPIAAISPVGPALWWAGGVVAMALMTTHLLVRGGPAALLGTIILAPAFSLTAASGNVNALLTPLLYLAWCRRRDGLLAAGSVAIATAMKLTPVFLAVWLGGHRGPRVLAWGVVSGTVVLLASLAGAGVQAHADWVRLVLPSTPAPLSLSALTGLPAAVVTIIAAILVALSALARRERLTFVVAVVAASLATPALYFTALASLGAALAPDTDRTRA